ncbi:MULTISPECIES: DUF742 domain-containing protein [Streptomyces]|uniref:DUF742 domain-containing protein n=1 Tax=Streptomyces albus (strain ATCC 21838 / DSM 41398 / FERM P-419 / JCM 4703 / NBRC 107858) TaxID=1081613 RepID=A0A0B5EZV9_STRA4|nr:DUF742 domain-containing protein [Streptomyces sp. SCSIO ZS0520]AJE84875.1 hypothetical protein SLNWT_4499 [Streptomyces albus]AOU79182.1 hypothetical protein SLNHY_4491 [Streptomyces albus]AYN34914.1 DUF742 domain-containing protein [Streptomyces albus]
MSRRRDPVRITPAYLATGGRTSARRALPDVLTRLIRVDGRASASLSPPQHHLLTAVDGGDLTLADAAGHLRLPVSAVRILAGDLLDLGLIQAVEPAELPDVELLESVLDGLRKLKKPA